MRRFAAVALREIVERRFVLVAAAVAAVLPFLVPVLPGVPRDQAGLARSITALTLACALGLGGSLLVGASVVGRELAERRLSFHFSRPLTGPLVWGGKLAGGLGLVLLSEAIVLLPSSAASGHFPALWGTSSDTWALWSVLALPVASFLAAWVGSVALRSRSPWLVVDLVLLVATPTLLFFVARRFIRFGGFVEPRALVGVAAGVALAALLAATLAQVVVGRTDARRGHGAQSIALWGILVGATIPVALLAERTIDPGLDRLVQAWAEPAGPGGDWVSVQGSARTDSRGWTCYVLNLRDGRRRLMPAAETASVSADGSRAAFMVTSPFSRKEIAVGTIDLESGASVSLDVAEWPDGFDLSADGRRLAVVSGGVCQVVELPSLRLLASARVPSPGWLYLPRFTSTGSVRLQPYEVRWGRVRGKYSPAAAPGDPGAADLNVQGRSLTTLARYPVAPTPNASPDPKRDDPLVRLVPSPDLSRVLAFGYGAGRGIRLFDAATGRVLGSFESAGNPFRPTGAFLSDGRVVIAEPVPEGCRLVLVSPDGDRLSELPLPAGTERVKFGFEPARGSLAIGLSHDRVADRWDWSLVDLGTGRLRPLGAAGVPLPFWSRRLTLPPPGSPATHLAYDADRRLVLLDPATGKRTPLTRGQPAGK